MKKYAHLFFTFFFFSVGGQAQQIHSPAEIMKIMEDSKLSYEMTMLDKPVKCADYSEKLNYHDVYRILTDSGRINTYPFRPNAAAKPLYDKAEDFFQANKQDSALFYYQLCAQADSSLSNVMTYIGQIYGSNGDNELAIQWYKLAIRKNYIDYMAHWFMADSYMLLGEPDSAVQEIVMAQIFNRNNPRIKKSMASIFEKTKRDTADWYFCPQVELNQVSDRQIQVAMTEKWIGYAIAKALWKYEPKYKESMGGSEGYYSTVEDKECLIVLLLGIENAKIKIHNDAQLRILKEAADRKYLEEYILYEIVLPQTPFVAYQLPDETLLHIKDYVLNIRNKK